MTKFRFAPIVLAAALAVVSPTSAAFASGGSTGGGGGGAVSGTSSPTSTPALDAITVSKCFINSAGQMLIKASSSNSNAGLFAYRPDGTLIGQIQNGGGSRYGGTVMPWQSYDPLMVTIQSTAGGSVTVPTTPFVI